MARLQTATSRFAFTLGMALLGVFPADILTSVTAGLHVARYDIHLTGTTLAPTPRSLRRGIGTEAGRR